MIPEKDRLAAIRQRTEEDRWAVNGAGWIGDDTCVGDKEYLLRLVDSQFAKLDAVEKVARRYANVALNGTNSDISTRTAAALAAGHIRIALEAKV